MKTLYLDCSMGAAGDMLAAALLELLPEPDEFIRELNELQIPGVVFQRKTSVKCGIMGTGFSVIIHGEEEGCGHHHSHGEEQHHHNHGEEEGCGHHYSYGEEQHHHNHGEEEGCGHHHSHGEEQHHHSHGEEHHHHTHNTLHDVEHIVRDHLTLPKRVQDNIMAVYRLIAEAESHVHGVPVSDIHFHEVGTMDAIADVTAVSMLIDRLAPDEIIVSPIHVGSGQVRCAHGILPVPAPATAYILQDVPVYGGEIRGELCTPTGAALLKHFAKDFASMPAMKVKKIGYGMGKKDFEAANCVRAMFGEKNNSCDEIYELSCNVDDMTGEEIGFAMEQLLAEGALDVYTTAIGMKKSRPGIKIQVMCTGQDKEKIIKAMFRHTTTIGIRENLYKRHILHRNVRYSDTKYGPVRCKISTGYGVERKKYEYEDIAEIAKANNGSVRDIFNEINK